MDDAGLILGLDIGYKYCQISYFEQKKKSVIPVNAADGMPIFTNNVGTGDIYKSCEGEISVILRQLIKDAVKQAEIPEIGHVCVTLHDYTEEMRRLFRKALKDLGIAGEDITIICKDEAFAYYVYTQGVEVGDTKLYDFTSRGLKAVALKKTSFKGFKIIKEEENTLADKDICAAAGGKLDFSAVSRKVVDFVKNDGVSGRFSQIYLTGAGFDLTSLPEEVLSALKGSKAKIFAGQNLFVRGACMMAACNAGVFADPFRRPALRRKFGHLRGTGKGEYLLTVKNRLTTEIKLNTVSFGEIREINISDIGESIDSLCETFECIPTKRQALQFIVTPVGGRRRYETIDLKDFPARESKCTRVLVNLYFSSEDSCKITASDLGFGDFYPTSGKEVISDIYLQKKEEPVKNDMLPGVIFCRGKRAKIPFITKETGIKIFSLEELVYYMYKNIFLIQRDFFSEDLLKFIANEVERLDISEKLFKLLASKTSVNYLVYSLFKMVDYYSDKEILAVEPVLDSIETANANVRMYSIAASFKKNKIYQRAIPIFERIITSQRDIELTDGFYANVYSCLAECFAALFIYDKAAVMYEKAFELGNDEKDLEKSFYARILSGTQSEIIKKNNEAPDIVTMLKNQDRGGSDFNVKCIKLFEKVKASIEEYKKYTSDYLKKEEMDEKSIDDLVEKWKREYEREAAI